MKIMHEIQQRLATVYPQGEARAMARILLEERFQLSQTDVLLDKDNDLSPTDLADLEEILARLLKKEPLQYVLGNADFMGRKFCVSPAVLIPRPETQRLVELVKESDLGKTESLRCLDMGTGSGCIAISLALELHGAQVEAWDISPEALAVADENAKSLGVNNLKFVLQDILHPMVDAREWDVIVSNPPYVRQLEAADMDDNVLLHEPHLALFVPDDDALRFYRAIAEYAAHHLVDGGLLVVEINQWLSKETVALMEQSGLVEARVEKDMFDNPRFVVCRRRK